MKKKMFFKSMLLAIIMLVVGNGMSWGATIFKIEFATSSSVAINGFVEPNYPNIGIAFSNTSTKINQTAGNASSGYTGASGLGVALLGTANLTLTLTNIDASGYSDLGLSFGLKKGKSNDQASGNIKVEYKDVTNNGSWTELSLPSTTFNTNWTLITASGIIPSTTNLSLRFTHLNNTARGIDDILLTGTSGISAPNIQASGITFASIGQTGMTINWASGNGAKRVVKMNTSDSFTAPTDGSDPSANAVYGGSGEQVIYNNSSNSVAITGLGASTTYHFRIYEYNGTGATTKYFTNTATGNPNSQATVAASCTTPTFSFATPTSVSKLTTDAAFTNIFTTNNISTKVWSSTNDAVATVDANGLVTIHSAGTTNIRVNQVADATYCAVVDASYALTVSTPEPTNHATSFTATTNSTSQITITWTDATGGQVPDGYLLKASTGAPTAPADGTAEADAALVKNIAQGTQTAVFTGLSASTTYNFSIWPYTNSGVAIDYKIGSQPTANATTSDELLGLQINSANSVYKIDFDNTVSNVNNGKFLGASANSAPAAGALNSNAFSFDISSSSSNSTFGTSFTGLGESTGGVSSSTTFYAFTVSENNNSLGIQPTGSNYTPGNVTFRFQNKTGSPITQLLVSYKVYILNNEARSNFIKLQHGDNSAAYNSVTSLDLTSTANIDVSPTWKLYFRSTKLTGLNIANNSTYCVRWTMDDVGGSTNRDEFALDDIEIVANPVTNNSEIGGTIEEAIIDGDITINSSVSANNITINSGKLLTVNPGKQLTVTTGIVNNGTLSLKSDATGTATFVDARSDANKTYIPATVQQYLPQGRNWYVGIPIVSGSASTLTAAGLSTSVSYWDETAGDWENNYTGTLTPGIGYIGVSTPAAGSGTNNVSFTGNLNTGNFPVTVTRTVTAANKPGFNLIANPYPSYLNPCALITGKTKLEPTIWYRTAVWLGEPDNKYLYSFETVNTADGVGTNGVTGYIPPMQAFWVKVLPNANPAINNSEELIFTNAMRYHSNPTIEEETITTTPLKAKESVSKKVVRLRISNGITNDEAVLYSNANAQNSFDKFDSRKMSNDNVAIPEIFTVVDNEQLVINGYNQLPMDVEIPLGFKTGKAGKFTLRVNEIKNLNENTALVVKDKVLNLEYNLTNGDAYEFNSAAANNTSRFSIIFRTAGVATSVDNSKLNTSTNVFVNANGELMVKTSAPLSADAKVSVYNAVGQLISIKPLSSGMTIANAARTAGVYWVKITNDGEMVTRKVIVN